VSTKWTADQKRVIDARNRNLLVSAAAGSGKTAVLIERILGRIMEEQNPVDIDQLLVVTFTRAAAGEMRERLNQAIEKKLQEDEENEHLIRQLTLIQNAQITTIDSFCSYILKNYFHVIGLDPNYRVMDEGEGTLLRQEVAQKLLEEYYQAEEAQKGAFTEFVETYATGKQDGMLEEYIFRLYEFAMSYPYPKEWLKGCIRAYETETMEEFLVQPWLTELTASIRKVLAELAQLLEEAVRICKEPGGPYLYEEALRSDLEQLGELQKAEDYQALYQALTEKKAWARLSAKKDENIEEEKKQQVKDIRETVKDSIGSIKEQYFPEDPVTVFEDMRACRVPASVLVELVITFMERFREKKREKNLLDFHDMEHLVLDILIERKDGVSYSTDTARELAAQFEEIMIDEYQDSNLVQEAILTSISRQELGESNLFMVGDVKQSIYRFRLARPELFMEKYQTYTKEESKSQRIDLSQNFRSRSEILAFTNQIFKDIMGKNLGNIIYDEAAALYPGANYPEKEKSTFIPEILFLDMDSVEEFSSEIRETSEELSARMVGERIRSMVGKEEIFDKELGAMRKMEYRDIVILFRSPSAFAESYQSVLGDMGIPVYVGTRSGYFSAREIQVMLSLLQIIDNPLQDIPLATVLASPLGGFSSKELAIVRSSAKENENFYEACRMYGVCGEDEKIREKMWKFYEQLKDFRAHVPYTPIHELLWYIFDVTGYEAYVSAMPSGEQRALNLKMLVKKAWDYEKSSYRGLFNFIRYIENLKKYDVDYGEAGCVGEEKNVVQIMSIHKSKGLEFPVVFVGGMEKQFNQQDTRSRLVLDVDLGAGCDLVDPVLRVRRPTLFKRCIQKKVKDDNLSEELRVLYVALTRAREKLILTGAVSGLAKKARTWYQNTRLEKEQLSYQQLSTASGYLDFLMPVLLKYESAAGFLEQMKISPKGFSEAEDPVWNEAFSIRVYDIEELLIEEMGLQVKEQYDLAVLRHMDLDRVYEEEMAAILKERMEGCYPNGDSRGIPMKLTVSQLKKQSQQIETDEEALLPEQMCLEETDGEEMLPEFLKEKQELKGAARGTAYHMLLQYLDFTRCKNKAEVKAQIEELERQGRLTGEEADVLDPWKIYLLGTSELGKRMAKAQMRGDLFREQHFVFGIPADTVYPEQNAGKELLVQGVIDAYFEEDGEWVLVDYKTDFVQEGEEELLYAKYQAQLSYYEKALCQLTGKPVREKCLYSLYLQKELREI